MLVNFRRIGTVSALVVVTASCQNGNIPSVTDHNMEQMDRGRERHANFSKDMTDSALLRDMALSDAHFIPHSAELNGLGASRLDRMAPMLDKYGGAVHYQTVSKEETLVKQRLDHIREYLKLTGCKMDRVTVATGLPGGHGLLGDEAVENMKQGTAKPEQGSGSTPLTISGGASGGGN